MNIKNIIILVGLFLVGCDQCDNKLSLSHLKQSGFTHVISTGIETSYSWSKLIYIKNPKNLNNGCVQGDILDEYYDCSYNTYNKHIELNALVCNFKSLTKLK